MLTCIYAEVDQIDYTKVWALSQGQEFGLFFSPPAVFLQMDSIRPYLPYIGGVVVSVGIIWVIKRRFWKKTVKRVCGKDFPRDVVIVHQDDGGPFTPSMSPFVVKLLTYLRLAKIPHQIDAGRTSVSAGPKHSIPWIEFNDVIMGDSHLIIQFLNEKFDVDLDATLDRNQKAHARALQVWMENFVYWVIVYTRWVILPDEMVTYCELPYSRAVMNYIKNLVQDRTHAHGIGRHSNEEINEFLIQDLQALSDHLGTKDFFMGSEPTLVDCAVFGQLAEWRWQMPDTATGKRLIKDKLTNLDAFCTRMKERAWPDWDQCLSKENFRNKTFCSK